VTSPTLRLLDRIDDLIEKCRAAKLQILDDTGLRWVDPTLLRRVFDALKATIELLEDIERSLADDEEEPALDEITPATAAEIADLAWLSRGEIVAHVESLTGSKERNRTWQIVSEADTGLERAERALVAVEAAILEHEGLPPTDRFRYRLEESLEIRRLYTALRRTFLVADSPQGAGLLEELWMVGTQIEAIRRRRAYGLIRVDDRRQLHLLQRRIEAALEQSDPTGEGERRALWQDLEAFSHLLMAINNREDLRAHDLELVIRARKDLDREDADAGAVYHRLASMLGRDPMLDRILVDPRNYSANDGRELVGRLESELRHVASLRRSP
jgi:hypothetical protein